MNSLIRLSFLFMILISTFAVGQRQIKLTNLTSGKVLSFKKGDRVVYTLKNQRMPVVGILTDIGVNEFTVEGNQVLPQDLYGFGRRKKGSGFGIFILSGLGAGMMVGSLVNKTQDPCPNCINTTPDNGADGGKVLGVVLGAGLIVLGITSTVRNSPRNLEKWKLEIVD